MRSLVRFISPRHPRDLTEADIKEYLLHLIEEKKLAPSSVRKSGQNEVSQELPEFGHRVFTYYLLEGLRGKADLDNNGTVTINEVMTYVEVQVKRKTKGDQNPTRSQTLYDKDLPMSTIDH